MFWDDELDDYSVYIVRSVLKTNKTWPVKLGFDIYVDYCNIGMAPDYHKNVHVKTVALKERLKEYSKCIDIFGQKKCKIQIVIYNVHYSRND